MTREKKTGEKLAVEKTAEKKKNSILETVLVIVVTIGWIILRVLEILKVDTNVLAQSEYIVKSFVNIGNSGLMADNLLELGYLYVLRGMFYLVGNHAAAVLWLQFALQFVGAFVLYRGLRKLIGRILAVLVYLAILILPCFFVPIAKVQPLLLVFFAGTLVIYLLSAIIEKLKNKKKESTQETSKEVSEETLKATLKEEVNDGAVTKKEVEKPKVKLLENPLPGPKKHVSKVLDYDLKLERMPRVFQRYDIKVSDEDDFDIK